LQTCLTPLDYSDHLDTWEGVPYLHQGSTRDGCDCIGLLIGCWLELGVDYRQYEVTDRQYTPRPRQLLKGLGAAMVKQPKLGVITPFDAVIVNDGTGLSYHCAIPVVADGGIWVLEASRGMGVVQWRRTNSNDILSHYKPRGCTFSHWPHYR
jgi:cell wall-associated NlpC family hydrolase